MDRAPATASPHSARRATMPVWGMVGVSLVVSALVLGAFAIPMLRARSLLEEIGELRTEARDADNQFGRYAQSVNAWLRLARAREGDLSGAVALPNTPEAAPPRLDRLVELVRGRQRAPLVEQAGAAQGAFAHLGRTIARERESASAIGEHARRMRRDQTAFSNGMMHLRSQIAQADGRARLVAARAGQSGSGGGTGGGAPTPRASLQPLLVEALDLGLQVKDLEAADDEDAITDAINNRLEPSLARLVDLAAAVGPADGIPSPLPATVQTVVAALMGDGSSGSVGVLEGYRQGRLLARREAAIQSEALENLDYVRTIQEALRSITDTRTSTLRVELQDSLSAALWRAGLASGIGMLVLVGLARVLAGNARRHVSALAESNRAQEALRKTAEAALRESQTLWKAVTDQYSVTVTDDSGRIIEANNAFCTISGYRREELLGQNHRIVNSGTHPAEFWAEAWRTVAAGGAWRAEVCNKAKDGTLYWSDSTITPFRDADGRIARYVAIRMDITDRKRAESALMHQSQVQEAMGRTARIGGWELDGATGKAVWTGEVYRIFELPETHIPTLDSDLLFFPEESRQIIREHLARAMETGEPFDYTAPFTTATGRNLWVRGIGKTEQRADGSYRLYGAFQDVTESHFKNAELVAARDAAQAASRAKSEFLANMSHEIRTPLTAILGFTDLLREEKALSLVPDRAEALDTIKNAGSHLMTVLNDILDLSKIEADRMVIESVETPLVKILRDVESMLRPRAAGKGVSLTTALATPVPERVIGDPTRLRQILMNLVGNAVKFTESGGVTITVGVEGTNGESAADGDSSRLVIDVEDTGPGMERAQADRLFAAFAQADSTVTRKFGGTGLGLAISRRLAALMGGDVKLLRTGVGKGSCFRLVLPLATASGSPMALSMASVKDSQGPMSHSPVIRLAGRILLAEDGPDNQRLIAFHLRKAGATVEVANNGRLALMKIEMAESAGRPYDLLVSDMQMPEIDGYTLARTLRERGSTLPIVALTAHAMSEDKEKCLSAGCDDYSTKPIDKARLLATCAAWMGRQSVATISSERET